MDSSVGFDVTQASPCLSSYSSSDSISIDARLCDDDTVPPLPPPMPRAPVISESDDEDPDDTVPPLPPLMPPLSELTRKPRAPVISESDDEDQDDTVPPLPPLMPPSVN